MKKEKLIHKIFISQIYELTAVEQFLEEMAGRGLMFVKATGVIYSFRKCEPIKVKFAVDIFDKASIFDTKEADATLEYIEYCEEAGWKFLYSTGKIQFFYTEMEEPIGIQTDDRIKLKYILKMQLLQYLLPWICVFFNSWMMFHNIFGEITYSFFWGITSGIMINTVIFMAVLCILVTMAILRFFSFIIQNLYRIKHGEKMKYNTIKSVRIFNGIYMFTCIFSLGILLLNFLSYKYGMSWFFIVLLAMFGILIIAEYRRMQNRKLSRSTNIIIVIAMSILFPIVIVVVMGWMLIGNLLRMSDSNTIPYKSSEGMITLSYSNDEVPMTLEDLELGIDEYDYIDSYANENSSIVASSREYSYGECFADEAKAEDDAYISYDIFATKSSLLMEKYLEFYLDEDKKVVTELTNHYAKAWKAKAVYTRISKPEEGESIEDFDTTYYIVYNDKVIVLSGDYKYTVEEAEKILEILDLN